jgi:benzoate membrane transport protein
MEKFRRNFVQPLSIVLPVGIFLFISTSFPLTAAVAFGLKPSQTATWIASMYLLSSVAAFLLAWLTRQPIMFGWGAPAMVFITSLAGQERFSDVQGATLMAGGCVLIFAAFGVSDKLAKLIPNGIVMGMLTGMILPYVTDIFNSFEKNRAPVGFAFAVLFLWRRFLTARIPAILPAMVTYLLLSYLTGVTQPASFNWSLPSADFMAPTFSLSSILLISPILALLISVQSNYPSVVFMRSEGFSPPSRLIDAVSGVTTMLGSFFGVAPMSMAVASVTLAAGPEAGDKRFRYVSVYGGVVVYILIAVFATVLADSMGAFPGDLLRCVMGFALITMLPGLLKQSIEGGLIIGPVIALTISLSKFSVFGLSPYLWSLIIAAAVSRFENTSQNRKYAAKDEAGSPTAQGAALSPTQVDP